MCYPKRLSISVTYTHYTITVDTRKIDCSREPEHCHVCNSIGFPIAKVLLDSCTFEDYPKEIAYRDTLKIIDTVYQNRDKLKNAYNFNKFNGTD